MSSILNRYLLKETFQTWAIVTLVLLLILLTNQFASVLGDAAANKLPRDAIAQVLGLTSVQYLTILMPVGYFLAVMLTLGRLYHDSEMAAMLACGIGPAQLYRPLLLLAGLLGVIAAGIALDVAPSALRQVQGYAAEARREASLGLIAAGRFVSFGDSNAALYAQSISADEHLHKVFVQRRAGDRVEVIVADEAWQTVVDQDSRVLTFARGRRYEGQPGDPRFRMVEFAEHGIPFSLPPAQPAKLEPSAQPSTSLLRSHEAPDLAELHWRLGVPLTLLVLTILSVPLGKTAPRQGRFSGLAPAVLVYLIYANLLAAGRGWLERGQVPAWLGLWWVHGIFLLAASGMLLMQSGSWRLPRRRSGRPETIQ